ncbi:MAG: hypothetical protein J6C11_03260 [Spirochaetaceae bacterium]|nr:hypothetical protein [Spirochaetaceae bacterium]
MKKLVRVSLFVLMALTLSLAIGCKHDSDPEPAPAPEPVKEGSRTPFVGTWMDEESGEITLTFNDDGTYVLQSYEQFEGKYHVSPDGKTVTVTTTEDGKEETITVTLKSEDTLELTSPDWGGKKVTFTKKVNADFAGDRFAGEWKSTDGSATATLKDGNFTTVMDGEELKGTYTVDGRNATTSRVQFPAELAGGSEVSVSLTMKMVDANDVMVLTVPTEVTRREPLDMTFVKKSTKSDDLTGTWTGNVVSKNNADATISFDNNGATLRSGGATVVSTNVTRNGNFFTITWQEGNPLDLSESTGLVSASGKAWLDDGSVFTKQQ